ncbi:phosphate acetyltransferase [Lentisphaerota bacterium WC36G]|nr:phosphate acetyltransferase [Lentisphaerae bacterium WC36]
MSAVEKFVAKAQKANKTLVLPEGQDPRVVAAANMIVKNNVAKIIVLGTEEEIKEACDAAGVEEVLFETLDWKNSDLFNEYVDQFVELRAKKGMTKEIATEKISDRIFFGSMMARNNVVDGLVAGSIASTGDMLRAGFNCVGTAPGIKIASSAFIMDLKTPTISGNKVLMFADCAVNPQPNAEQLADIAQATAATYKALFNDQPKVAFLGFSTFGSAKHDLLNNAIEASKILKERIKDDELDIIADGEYQLDAALVPAVAAAKAKGGNIAGDANILIFPDLNAGNIGYKLVERLAGATAIGPALQGLARPLNDLSRGCSIEDIYSTAALTVCQAMG